MLIAQVMAQIEKVEAFAVIFMKKSVEARQASLIEDVRYYDLEKPAPSTWTVHEWAERRFAMRYPGYYPIVLFANGQRSESAVLAAVRASYEEGSMYLKNEPNTKPIESRE
jgi:hypothetical protein